jgi:hypothetical protein
VAGGLCCAWFVGTLLFGALRLLQSGDTSFASTLRLCGFTACWGLLVHSLVDFNLHIPSNLLLFLLISLLATAEIRHVTPEDDQAKRRRSPVKP